MTLNLTNKGDFVNSFLFPLSRIGNNCVLKLGESGISTLLSAADNTVVLYGIYEEDLGDDVEAKLNIPDIQRLIKVLQCVDTDSMQLEVESNKIKYSSADLRFKYHLLSDGILSMPPLKIEKIKQLTYDTSFTIPYNSFVSLLKSSTFTLSLNKMYFFTKDGNVYAEINDKESHNVDSICLKMCDSFTGEPIDKALPVGFETIRTLAGLRCEELVVKVNSKLNVMTFSINIGNVRMTYIVSGLIK